MPNLRSSFPHTLTLEIGLISSKRGKVQEVDPSKLLERRESQTQALVALFSPTNGQVHLAFAPALPETVGDFLLVGRGLELRPPGMNSLDY